MQLITCAKWLVRSLHIFMRWNWIQFDQGAENSTDRSRSFVFLWAGGALPLRTRGAPLVPKNTIIAASYSGSRCRLLHRSRHKSATTAESCLYAQQVVLHILSENVFLILFFQSDCVYIAREMTVLARAMNFYILELHVNWVVLSLGPSPDRLYDSANSYSWCESWKGRVESTGNMMKFQSCLKNVLESRTGMNGVCYLLSAILS